MKRIVSLLLMLPLVLSLAACGGDSAPGTSAAPNAGSSSSEEQIFTGTLEEDKGTMIIVRPDGDGDAIVFGTEGLDIDAEIGDKVTVTFTGDIEEVGSSLTASKVDKAE